MKRPSRISAVITIATFGLGAAFMSPAQANPAADKAMLTERDVPASFGKPQSRDFDAKIVGKTIGICGTAQGETLVSIPAPPTQYIVDIETKNKKTYTEVMERVYQFGSADKATAAFDQLKSQLSTCNGTTSMTSQTPSITQTNTTGSYDSINVDNFWINNSATWRGGELKKPSRTVLQGIYTLADTAIVETVVYINGRSKLTAKQERDLANLATSMTNRFRSFSIGDL
jgi:hypothetical protein